MYLFITLRKSTTFRKVYWSVPFVTLRKSTTFRKVYWSVPFVCLFVCLSVCPASYRPQFCTDQDYFFYSRFGIPPYRYKTFFEKIGQMSRSRSPKTMKTTIWVITFESDVVETSGWSQNVPYRKPHSGRGLRFDARRTVFASRDVKENITMFSLFLISFWKYSHISKTAP